MGDLSALSFLKPHYRWACQERRLHSFTKEKIKEVLKNTKRYDFGTGQRYFFRKQEGGYFQEERSSQL